MKQAQTIKVAAKKPKLIKNALREWVKKSEVIDSDPLGIKGAPLWVEKAWIEVVKVIMPGGKIPTSGEWDLELIGELFGRLHVFANLYNGKIALRADVQNECDRIKAQLESQPKSRAIIARRKMTKEDLEGKMAALQSSIPPLLNAALSSSHEDGLKFQKGLLRGMHLDQDELLTANTFHRHTKIFWILATQWRRWIKCRSVMEVHRILCAELGEIQVGSLKTFQNRVAKPIGFKLGNSGRPKKLQ